MEGSRMTIPRSLSTGSLLAELEMGNRLFLNPRLPQSEQKRFAEAWNDLVDHRMAGLVGIVTSGSSADAYGKLIALSKDALLESAAAVNRHLRASRHDVWMKTLPDFHVGGLGIHLRARLSRSTLVESRLQRWEPVAFHNELVESEATLLSLVPTQVFDLVQAGLRAPSSLRALIVGGGRLEPELMSRAVAMGWPVMVSYGLTECCSQVATVAMPGEQKLRPLSHVRLRIREDGRIQIDSRSLLAGQVVLEKDHATWRPHEPGEWFTTDDEGQIETDGSVTVHGRVGDYIKIGGEGVVMSRLEDRLMRLRLETPFAEDSALLAVRDERLGAFIVLVTDATEERSRVLVEKFNTVVAPFERIRQVFRLERLPRSPLGKLQRRQTLESLGLQGF